MTDMPAQPVAEALPKLTAAEMLATVSQELDGTAPKYIVFKEKDGRYRMTWDIPHAKYRDVEGFIGVIDPATADKRTEQFFATQRAAVATDRPAAGHVQRYSQDATPTRSEFRL